MATTIFLILCAAAVGFLLYCLFHFAVDAKRRRRRLRQPGKNIWDLSPKSHIVPLQLVGPASIALWSHCTWDRFLSLAGDSDSREANDKRAMSERYDTAA